MVRRIGFALGAFTARDLFLHIFDQTIQLVARHAQGFGLTAQHGFRRCLNAFRQIFHCRRRFPFRFLSACAISVATAQACLLQVLFQSARLRPTHRFIELAGKNRFCSLGLLTDGFHLLHQFFDPFLLTRQFLCYFRTTEHPVQSVRGISSFRPFRSLLIFQRFRDLFLRLCHRLGIPLHLLHFLRETPR